MAFGFGSGSIKVETRELENLSNVVVSLNDSLNNKLIEIKNCVNQILEIWDSPSGQAASEQFAKMLPDFERSTAHINKYAKFLSDAAETYESAERSISQNANRFI